MKYIIPLIGALLLVSAVAAHGDQEDFGAAASLIEQQVPCDQLNDSQLELIGDYYMEQMHPGEAHEAMDQMMGGEGSESLRSMHIAMAENIYCGQDGDYGYGGMMGMMGGSGMMGGNYRNARYGGGMMGYPYDQGRNDTWLWQLLAIAAIVGLVIVLANRKSEGGKKR